MGSLDSMYVQVDYSTVDVVAQQSLMLSFDPFTETKPDEEEN